MREKEEIYSILISVVNIALSCLFQYEYVKTALTICSFVSLRIFFEFFRSNNFPVEFHSIGHKWRRTDSSG